MDISKYIQFLKAIAFPHLFLIFAIEKALELSEVYAIFLNLWANSFRELITLAPKT